LQDLVRLIEGLWHNEFFLNMKNVGPLDESLNLFGIFVQQKSLILVGVSLVMLVALTWLVNRTRLGLAIRSVAQDPSTAGLMGINPEKIISRTFLIGGALGGVAGVLFALQYTTVSAYVGFLPGIKAFTAAVLGGIGNIPGAVVGGLVLGEIETLAGTFLPTLTDGAIGTEYKDVIAFLILILLLLFRPQGLLGQVVKEKV
jgi:branched-chain amino acid transport system permease protein